MAQSSTARDPTNARDTVVSDDSPLPAVFGRPWTGSKSQPRGAILSLWFARESWMWNGGRLPIIDVVRESESRTSVCQCGGI